MQRRKPAHFGFAHGVAALGRVVVGAGEVIKPVGDVEREFRIGSIVGRAFADGAFDVDDEIAGGGGFFAGDGVVAKADDIGGAVFV